MGSPMFRLLFSFLWLLAAALISVRAALGAELLRAPVPDWVVGVASGEASPTNAGFSGGVDYLLADLQIKVTKDQTYRYSHYVDQARTEEGVQNVAQVTVDFDPEYQKLVVHTLRVLRDGQVLDKLDLARIDLLQREEDLESKILDGRKTAHLVLEDVRIGDLVEYSYTVEGRNPAFHNRYAGAFDLQWSVPVRRVFYRLSAPREVKLNFRSHGSDAVFARRDDGEEQVHSLDIANVPALAVDDDVPDWFVPHPWIQVSEYRDWADVVDWALPNYSTAKTLPDTIERQARELREASDGSAPGMILATLRFVQNDVRYMGIELGSGSFVPTDPSTVLARRFGDCKDKVTLMRNLLHALGIEAFPALVNTKLRHGLSELLASPTLFDHVILWLELDGKDYWLDPTRLYQEGSLDTLYQPDYGNALVVKAGVGGLRRMHPAGWIGRSKDVSETIYAADEADGPSRMTILTRYRGGYADSMRRYFANETLENIQKEYTDFWGKYYAVRMTGSLRYDDDKARNVVSVTEEYEIDKLWTLDEDEHRLIAEFFPTDLDTYDNVPDNSTRRMPLSVGEPTRVQMQSTIHLPGRWRLDDEHHSVQGEVFEFNKDVEYKSNVLKIAYDYTLHKDSVPPEKMAQYVDDVSKMYEQTGMTLWRPLAGNKELPAPVSAAQGLVWSNAVLAVIVFGACVAFAMRISRFDPEPRVREGEGGSVGIGGWLLLPAFNMIVTPIVILVSLSNLTVMFDPERWQGLTQVGMSGYHPLWAPLLLFELIGAIAYFVFGMALGWLFFNKRSNVPRLYICFLLFVMAYYGIDAWISQYLPAVADDSALRPDIQALRVTFWGLVWIAYFSVSKRVAATFTVRRKRVVEANAVAMAAATGGEQR